jgi:hypothetical protein
MTKKMEDFFNLPPTEKPAVEEELPTKSREQLMIEATEINNALTTAEKIDFALPVVVGLESHDNEMDEVAKRAMAKFEDLCDLGGNVPDMHAGKIFEVAAQFLKIAADSKISKADKKLKMIDLQLKKVRSEQIDLEQGNGDKRQLGGGEFDRNELLKYIVSSKSENSDK